MNAPPYLFLMWNLTMYEIMTVGWKSLGISNINIQIDLSIIPVCYQCACSVMTASCCTSIKFLFVFLSHILEFFLCDFIFLTLSNQSFTWFHCFWFPDVFWTFFSAALLFHSWFVSTYRRSHWLTLPVTFSISTTVVL